MYGACASRYFRYFSVPIARSITLTGQAIIRLAERAVNEYLNKVLHNNRPKDYVIAIDTDSLIIDLEDLVNKVVSPTAPVKTKTDFLDNVCRKIETDVLEPTFRDFATRTNALKERISIKREVIATRGIWVAKKRYILNVLDNEGVRYAEPKLKIMGLEVVKSSTPMACRSAMKELFKVIMNSNTEEETQDYIAKFKEAFIELSPEEKAFPRGVSSLKKYLDSNTLYKRGKSVPIHSRAAILYNYLLKEKSLDDRYEMIQEGDKIKYVYLNPQNPLRENIIGFKTRLPREFNLDQYIDNDLQFQKSFLAPVMFILDAIGWKPEKVSSLDDFFTF